MKEQEQYDQSIINILRWHHKFDLETSKKLLKIFNELNEVHKRFGNYLPLTGFVSVLKEYNDYTSEPKMIPAAEAGKMLRDIIRKVTID